jgi:hypothetical protein
MDLIDADRIDEILAAEGIHRELGQSRDDEGQCREGSKKAGCRRTFHDGKLAAVGPGSTASGSQIVPTVEQYDGAFHSSFDFPRAGFRGIAHDRATMKITRVCCQGCGANLEVDETVRFVTCNYCHAKLEVVCAPSVTHTRVLEEPENNTRQTEGNLRIIGLRNDLERLDWEWESRRQGLMVSNKHGQRHIPTAAGSIAGGILVTIVGVIWIGAKVSMGAPIFVPMFGVVFICVAVYSIIKGTSMAAAHQRADLDFNSRRSGLVREIEKAKREG